jgi:hypothetical protein
MGFRVSLHGSNLKPLMSALGHKRTLKRLHPIVTTRPSLDRFDHDSGPAQKRAVFVPLIGAACAAIDPCKCLILPNVVPPKADMGPAVEGLLWMLKGTSGVTPVETY